MINFTLLIATVGSGAGAQMAGARLLFGMGRDGVLSKSFFGAIDEKSRVPRNAVLTIGAISLLGSFLLTYQTGAELLNFGAFIGFMGVNLAALLRYFVRAERKQFTHLIVPVAGFLICGYMWINLSSVALRVGAIWAVLGFAFGAYQTGGFKKVSLPPE